MAKIITEKYKGKFLILWGTVPFFAMPKLIFFSPLSKQNACTGNSY